MDNKVQSRQIEDLAENLASESIFKYFFNRKTLNQSHVFLSNLFPSEYQIRSAIGGLETSLGTKLWEQLARELAEFGKFKILDPKLIQKANPALTKVETLKNSWHRDSMNRKPGFTIEKFKYELEKLGLPEPVNIKFTKPNKGEGVDIYLRKSGTDYLFDIKTVQWNAGSGPKFHQTLLSWISNWKTQQLNTSIKAFFVIPYGEPSEWWKNFNQRAFPLTQHDVLIADEFWSLLTGMKGAYTSISNGLNRIKSSSEKIAVFRKCLTDPMGANEVELLRVFRHVQPVAKLLQSKIDRRKDFEWHCVRCGAKFKSKVNQIVENKVRCSNCEFGQ